MPIKFMKKYSEGKTGPLAFLFHQRNVEKQEIAAKKKTRYFVENSFLFFSILMLRW